MCSDPLPPTPQEYNIIALDQPLTPVDFEFVVPEGMCCPDFNKEGPLSLYHDENNNLVMEDTPGTSQTDFHQVCFSGNMEWKGAFSPEKGEMLGLDKLMRFVTMCNQIHGYYIILAILRVVLFVDLLITFNNML